MDPVPVVTTRRGATVAVIGTDGAGKSSVVAALLEASQRPARVVYMGLNPGKANTPSIGKLVGRSTSDFRGETGDPHGPLWRALRTVYRILEETMRFVAVARYRRAGELVLLDRHFRFDHALGTRLTRLSDRVHVWFLEHLTPLPDLVLYLRVPADVAMARKGEGSEAYHLKRITAYDAYAERMDRVTAIDATRPLDDVVAEAERAIDALFAG